MKCDCERCDGLGKLICPSCDGSGSREIGIAYMKINPEHPHADDFKALRGDYFRVKLQAETLCELNPGRAKTYQAQLKACVEVIEKQADELLGKK